MNPPTSILIGSDEPSVTEALRVLLMTTAQDCETFQFTTSSRYDEFIQQARTGEFGVAIMHANCLVPTQPSTLLEQAVLAVKSIKASCPLRLVVLTTFDG